MGCYSVVCKTADESREYLSHKTVFVVFKDCLYVL